MSDSKRLKIILGLSLLGVILVYASKSTQSSRNVASSSKNYLSEKCRDGLEAILKNQRKDYICLTYRNEKKQASRFELEQQVKFQLNWKKEVKIQVKLKLLQSEGPAKLLDKKARSFESSSQNSSLQLSSILRETNHLIVQLEERMYSRLKLQESNYKKSQVEKYQTDNLTKNCEGLLLSDGEFETFNPVKKVTCKINLFSKKPMAEKEEYYVNVVQPQLWETLHQSEDDSHEFKQALMKLKQNSTSVSNASVLSIQLVEKMSTWISLYPSIALEEQDNFIKHIISSSKQTTAFMGNKRGSKELQQIQKILRDHFDMGQLNLFSSEEISDKPVQKKSKTYQNQIFNAVKDLY